MAEHKEESAMDKISEKFHGSSSGSDDEGKSSSASAAAAVKAKIYRLFGREKPVHSVLGGGKRESALPQPLLLPLFASGGFVPARSVDPAASRVLPRLP
jgi:hypothetical protein